LAVILASYFLAEATEKFSSLEEAKCNERKLYNWGKGLNVMGGKGSSESSRDNNSDSDSDDPGYSL
jgi:hypothetical protein